MICRDKKGRFVDGPQPEWVRHGLWGTPTYRSWHLMLQRCRNKNHQSYAAYGGRGIVVCDRWLTFVGFLEDMGERPAGLTLVRRDTGLGYWKSNCVWGPRPRQDHSRRTTKLTLEQVQAIRASRERGVDLAREHGVTPATISMIRRGKSWTGK